jgi:phospholipid-binding lipoprotein MlaA
MNDRQNTIKAYFLIGVWLAAASCAFSIQDTPNLPASSLIDANSLDAVTGESQKEYSPDQVIVPDPIEGWNQAMLGINDVLYSWIERPVMQTYKKIVPQPARIGVGNFFKNLTTPVRLVNCLLQGKGAEANME